MVKTPAPSVCVPYFRVLFTTETPASGLPSKPVTFPVISSGGAVASGFTGAGSSLGLMISIPSTTLKSNFVLARAMVSASSTPASLTTTVTCSTCRTRSLLYNISTFPSFSIAFSTFSRGSSCMVSVMRWEYPLALTCRTAKSKMAAVNLILLVINFIPLVSLVKQ